MTKRSLQTSEERIKNICNILRYDTLEPAQKEAEKIIADAKTLSEKIIADAKKQADELVKEAHRNIQRERTIFHSSLQQASKQAIEALKQSIEHRLFNPELHDQLSKQIADPKIIAALITAIVKALEKEGLAMDLTAVVASTVTPQQINHLLTESILNKLKDRSVTLGDFSGGVQVRIDHKKMVLDMSLNDIEEALRQYVRKDFRKLLFKNDAL